MLVQEPELEDGMGESKFLAQNDDDLRSSLDRLLLCNRIREVAHYRGSASDVAIRKLSGNGAVSSIPPT